MGQIRMTPDSMRGRANEYRTEAEHVGEVISKMDTLLQNLQAEWEGAAATSYAEKFGELRPSFVKAQELINEIASALDASANATEETDNNIASSFKS